MKQLLIFLVKIYQWVFSPWLGRNCRFSPSCSAYAIEAVQKYGSLHGGWMAVRRLLRCHPWHPGGCDPVP